MVETYGFDEFINKLDKLEAGFEKGAVKVLEETGDLAVAETQLRTPVDTGTLRRSMARSDVEDYSVSVGSAIHYARYIEEGTRFINPFLMLRDGSTVARVKFESQSKKLFEDITKELKI